MRLLIGFAILLGAFTTIWFFNAVATTFLVNLVRPVGSPARAEAVHLFGTITYYPNGSGRPVPYLVYADGGGGMLTKALVFDYSSACQTSTTAYPCPLIADALEYYFGAGPVDATGIVVASHLVVERLTASTTP